MRVLFCDDNAEILSQIKGSVAEYFSKNGLKQPEYVAYTSGDDVVNNDEYADIAFLDVEMSGISGIYVGEYLKRKNAYTKIFIVTSYPDYLDEAMRFHVFRYLSKPVDKNRLFRNLKDALYQLSVETKKIAVEMKDGVITCSSDEIVYLEKVGRKTFICVTDELYQTVDGIEKWAEKLNLPCFYEPYRGFIINMKYVSSFDKDTIILKFKGQEKTVYLAKRRYTEFKDKYIMYLESMK